MQVPKKILTLIEKYQAGTASEQEKLILDEWYCSFNDAETEIITTQEETEQQISDRIKIRLLKTIEQQGEISIAKPRRKWQMAAAAAIILILVGAYFLVPSKSAEQQLAKTQPSKPQLKNDIVPGGNKAILTLANGAAIALDSAANGTISQQGNIEVKKLNSGLLAYTINGKQITENDEAIYPARGSIPGNPCRWYSGVAKRRIFYKIPGCIQGKRT
jgi:transmembrane sensor